MNKRIGIAMVALVAALSISGCGNGSSTAQSATKAETPQSCIDALDVAEKLVTGPVAEETADMPAVINLIPKAYKAGLTGDAVASQQIVDALSSFTDKTQARTAEIKTLSAQYLDASTKCRAGR